MAPTILKTLNTLVGKSEVTKDMVASEIKRVFLFRPAFLRIFERNSNIDGLFLLPPRTGFCVFDELGIVKKN